MLLFEVINEKTKLYINITALFFYLLPILFLSKQPISDTSAICCELEQYILLDFFQFSEHQGRLIDPAVLKCCVYQQAVRFYLYIDYFHFQTAKYQVRGTYCQGHHIKK